jgi:hypothetical protein
VLVSAISGSVTAARGVAGRPVNGVALRTLYRQLLRQGSTFVQVGS